MSAAGAEGLVVPLDGSIESAVVGAALSDGDGSDAVAGCAAAGPVPTSGARGADARRSSLQMPTARLPTSSSPATGSPPRSARTMDRIGPPPRDRRSRVRSAAPGTPPRVRMAAMLLRRRFAELPGRRIARSHRPDDRLVHAATAMQRRRPAAARQRRSRATSWRWRSDLELPRPIIERAQPSTVDAGSSYTTVTGLTNAISSATWPMAPTAWRRQWRSGSSG